MATVHEQHPLLHPHDQQQRRQRHSPHIQPISTMLPPAYEKSPTSAPPTPSSSSTLLSSPPTPSKPHPTPPFSSSSSSSSSSLTPPPPLSTSSPTSSDPHYTSHWLCFFLLGLINNFHYVIVLSSALSLATSFSAVRLIGVIQWATVLLGMGVKVVNTLYLLHTSHSLRILAASILCMAGLAMLTLSPLVSFPFAILAILLIGGYSALGESVVLGYLRHFHPRLTGAWSSGTGISGVAGTLGYLLMYSVWGWSNPTIYLAIAPTCIIYLLAFRHIRNTAPPGAIDTPTALPAAAASVAMPLMSDDSVALLPAQGSGAVVVKAPSGFADAWRIMRQQRRLCFHLTLVYVSSHAPPPPAHPPSPPPVSSSPMFSPPPPFPSVVSSVPPPLAQFLEYVIIVGFASQANPAQADASWAYRNAYELLSFCYQLGVLVSRSSIALVQVRRIEWINAVQALNFVVWFVQAYAGLMPLPLQFAWMVGVGLMGGAMYVNVFYLLREDRGIKEEERELAINVVASIYYVGIISSSLVEIVLLNTILTRQH